MSGRHKKESTDDYNIGVRSSVQHHTIQGIELNSKDRVDLKHCIEQDILQGFTPQIPQLSENFDVKFIPVVSQNGHIVAQYFVIKITVIAPIFDADNERIQFRTKDGYAHVIDFDF